MLTESVPYPYFIAENNFFKVVETNKNVILHAKLTIGISVNAYYSRLTTKINLMIKYWIFMKSK